MNVTNVTKGQFIKKLQSAMKDERKGAEEYLKLSYVASFQNLSAMRKLLHQMAKDEAKHYKQLGKIIAQLKKRK